MRMEKAQPNAIAKSEVEFVKGCPLCERSDPELERDLEAFAQLLFDVFLYRHQKAAQTERSPGVDNRNPSPTLKERSNQ